MNQDKQNSYTDRDIQVLEGLEAVRIRPGMYIGSTDERGLHNAIREIIDNSVDEALAGFADLIIITIEKDNSIIVSDNGRGVPVTVKKGYGVSALELVMTKLHAGGKFGGNGYKVSSGLHGVGASVVNALSEYCRVEVRRNGKLYNQEYRKGVKQYKLKEEDSDKSPINLESIASNEQGTTTKFKPDLTVFETDNWDYKTIRNLIKLSAYLTSKLKFKIIDKRTDTLESFYFEGGLKSLISTQNRDKKIVNNNIFYVNKKYNDIDVEVSFQYTDAYSSTELSFANNLRTREGGTHLTGFKSALTKALNDYAKKNKLFKDGEKLTGDDVREGLIVAVSVKLESDKLQFEGQTKNKLGTSEARTAVESVVKEALDTYLEENPKEAELIINQNLLASRARKAARAARDAVIRKGALEGSGLPSKLADCRSKNPAESEIFIVEGDSAGGSAKQARDQYFQAILPIFGKVLNTERKRLDQVVKSEKYKIFIKALGAGIGESFDIKNARYHKIIIMADADVDGLHISALHLTFFYRHLPSFIEHGMVYLAVPPLYKATWGKNKKYLINDTEKEEFEKEMKGKPYSISRFKGLGEMNYDELSETTMHPKTRILKQITVEDVEEANKTFEMLMGTEVAPRKHFIQANAKSAILDSHA